MPILVLSVHDLGVRAAGMSGGHDPTVEVFTESIKEKVRPELQPGQSGIKYFRLPKENAFSRRGLKVDSLAALPILGKSSEELGWVMAVYHRGMLPENELLLVAATQHLRSLQMISASDSALAQRDQFLSIASHELKTPLTSIYGLLQLQERMLRPKPGQEMTPEREKQHTFFKMVIRQTERLNELIDGLLNVSRICNGRFVVDPSEADVANIARETVTARLNIIAQEAGVGLTLEAPEHLVAPVDPVRFEEVITNLGMNSIRFSPEGGMVWIRLKQDDDTLTVSFRDQGPNVPITDRERIFQPFERAQRTSRLGGLGLGLFISKQIAQLHGGDVTLSEAEAGKGNLFVARFPLKTAGELSAEAVSA